MNKMERNWYESIEAYNLGHLSAEQTAQFEAAMRADDALAAAVRAHRTEWEMQELLAENLLRTRIREQMAGQPAAPEAGNSGAGRLARNWKYALMLLLLGGLAFFVFRKPATHMPAEQTQPTQGPPEMPVPNKNAPPVAESPAPESRVPVADADQPSDLKRIALASYRIPEGLSGIRGQNDDDQLTLATQAFFKKEYRETLRLLDTLPETDRQEALSLRAHAYFATGKFRSAARDFDALKAGGIYRREAEWYLLLSHMAIPGADKAALKDELDTIRRTANHPYQKEAEALGKSPFLR